jgi:hypothetical protein
MVDSAVVPATNAREWRNTSLRLRFKFAGRQVFAVPLAARVLECPSSSPDSTPAEAFLPPDLFSGSVDVFLLRLYPIEEPQPSITSLPNAIRYTTAPYPHFWIDLNGTFANYLEHFSAKTRSTLNRKRRRFGEHSGGEIDARQYRSPEDVAEFRKLAADISKRTYQERVYNVGIPQTEPYWQKMLDRAAEDSFRGYILFHAGTPIAYLCCPADNGILDYQFLGYDPAFKSWSPGDVLQMAALEMLFAEQKFRSLDFGEGGGQHKEMFSTHHATCVDVYSFRHSLRNWLLVRLHQGMFNFSELAVGLVARLGLKERIKRRLKAGAAKPTQVS